MPRKPVRDWITSEEAAIMLGITGARFRDYLVEQVRRVYLPNSVLVTRTWLHYIGDVQRLKAYRDTLPRASNRKTPKRPAEKAQDERTA